MARSHEKARSFLLYIFDFSIYIYKDDQRCSSYLVYIHIWLNSPKDDIEF
jgi:hypothetical protein